MGAIGCRQHEACKGGRLEALAFNEVVWWNLELAHHFMSPLFCRDSNFFNSRFSQFPNETLKREQIKVKAKIL